MDIIFQAFSNTEEAEEIFAEIIFSWYVYFIEFLINNRWYIGCLILGCWVICFIFYYVRYYRKIELIRHHQELRREVEWRSLLTQQRNDDISPC